MKNILLYPNAFVDNDGYSPPMYWNSEAGRYDFIFSSYGQMFTASSYSPAAGDYLEARLENRGTSTVSIYVSNGSINEMFELAAGETRLMKVENLEAEPLNFTIQVRTGNIYAIDMAMTPIVQDDSGGGDLPGGADTYSLKGFLSFGSLVDNVDHKVALLGELSVRSMTYSRDRELFATGTCGATGTAITATVFSSRSAADGKVTTPPEYGDLLSRMGAWMWNEALNGTFTANGEEFRQYLLAEYGTVLREVTIGPMLQQGQVWLPESITFYPLADELISDNVPAYLSRGRVKVWLSNAAFSTQYDEYSYEFLAPVDTLDDFFKVRAQVEQIVASRTDEEVFQKLQALANGDPYTILRSIMFEYRDPDDPTYRLPTNWRFIIYGAAGDNIDAIKERLIEWILENSEHTREEWAEIFPDIFTSTEFILIPLMNQYAIPNKTIEPGMYSPTVLMVRGQEIARRMAIGTKYTQAHIDSVLSVVPTTYKTVTVLAVGGPENRDGVNKFYDQWKDYINVPTTSIDYDRMDPVTSAFVARMHMLLKIAEEMTEFSDIPIGFTRLTRKALDGTTVLYVVTNYNNVQYLAASKYSVSRLFPPASETPLRLTVQGVDDVDTLQNGRPDETYHELFRAMGGQGPYTYSLPAGLPDKVESHSIDPVTGAYTATFLRSGQTTITVIATDANGNRVQKAFSLYVIELT